jgi:hypothetical protein
MVRSYFQRLKNFSVTNGIPKFQSQRRGMLIEKKFWTCSKDSTGALHAKA